MDNEYHIKFYIDYETGEAHMETHPKFKKQNALFRADCLKDCINELTPLYTEAMEEWRNE